MDRQTDRLMDAREKTICLPTLKGGDITICLPTLKGGDIIIGAQQDLQVPTER